MVKRIKLYETPYYEDLWRQYVGSKFLSEQSELEMIRSLKGTLTKGILYEFYMKSKYWQRIKAKIIDRDGYQCVSCSTNEHLQLHHMKYSDYGEENPADLITLCMYCHAEITQGRRALNLLKPKNIENKQLFQLIHKKAKKILER